MKESRAGGVCIVVGSMVKAFSRIEGARVLGREEIFKEDWRRILQRYLVQDIFC